MRAIIEISGGLITSLLSIKGLSLIISVFVAFSLGQTQSKIVLLTDLVILSLVMLPIMIGFIILMTLVITFSLCFPKNNNFRLFIGYAFAILLAYSFNRFFLTNIGSLNIWTDLIMGFLFILSAIALGKLSTKYLLNVNS